MATVNKDFKIKNGLIVEGSTATVNGNPILTENASDQYIIDLIGGETLVTSVSSDFRVTNGELQINSSSDLVRTGDLPTSTDDISEGTTNKYYTDARVKNVLTTATKTNIVIEEIAGELHISAENGVADSTTDDLDEGTTNQYFTTQRARDSFSAGSGISLSAGEISANLSGSGGLGFSGGKLEIDRTTVDTWYDASGAASTVQSNLDDHASDTSTHGVTGAIVGTTDTQSLSNKSLLGTTSLYDPTETYIGAIGDNGSADLVVGAENDLLLSSSVGDIVINASGSAYYGSASAANELATHGYVDNAVSGLDWKNAVNVLANANVPLTGFTSPMPFEIDGHTVDNGYRVLLTAQSTDSENGIYDAAVSGGTYTLTRSTDADAFAELVGAAVYVMEGTTYGATSWVQSNHYLTDFTSQDWTQFSGTGSVTAGTGITVDGLEVSIDRTTVDGWYDAAGAADTAYTNAVNDAMADATYKANNAESNANNYTDTAIGNLNTDSIPEPTGATNKYFTDARARDAFSAGTGVNISSGEISVKVNGIAPEGYNAVETDPVTGDLIVLNTIVPATTDDLAEGVNNHYFTDSRARTAAIDLLVNHSTKNNITIVEDTTPGNIIITAENGVADSTTDDLDEGSTNLYFSEQRVLDAISGSPDIAPQKVSINTYRKEEATQQYVASTSTVTAHTFAYPYGSAKYLVRVVGSVGGVMHTQVTELLATIDGNNNVAVTEYGTIHTSENALATATVDYASGEFRLRVTTLVGGAEVIAAATLLSWAD